MAQKIINIGSTDYAGDGESLRTAFSKVNDNFDEVYVNLGGLQSFDGDYNSLTNKPDLSVYALTANTFNGDYNNLVNRPTLFSGLYADLTGAPSVPSQLEDLADVNINSVTDGQILAFDNASGSFINVNPDAASYGDSDVNSLLNVSTATSGQILSWTGADYQWVADQTGSGGGIALTDLSVTDTSTGGANLEYNNLTGVFTFSYTAPTVPTDISELTDNTGLLGGGGGTDFSTLSVTIGDETDPQSIADALNELVTQLQGL
ncbi:MAG: hypothetical protein VW551_00725 [Euryarchaeota archaeon]|jgi:hypothetical protein